MKIARRNEQYIKMHCLLSISVILCYILLVMINTASPKAQVGNDSNPCSLSIAATGGNTVTCNFGLTPEQLRQVTGATVNGATGPFIDRITEISKTLGVTQDAAKALLKIVGEDPNIPDDKLASALSKVAGDYKKLQAQAAALNPENPTARALVKQAGPEIDAGHLDRAHELLRQATQAQIAAVQEARKLSEQAQAAEDAQMLGAASSTAAEGEIAITERQFAQAAEFFKEAASYVPVNHPTERIVYVNRQAGALYKQGYELGDNDALRNASDLYRIALQAQSRERVPSDWARTQANLGDSLTAIGEREAGTTGLEEGIAAYRAALEVQTHESAPLDWARTQASLGNALVALGERESGTARLEDAILAYRAALEVQTRERVPLDWARTQTSLSNALVILGERESGTARLVEAVAEYRAALQELTREQVPLDWARTQASLGNALVALGERESDAARLVEAVEAYRAALQELTRERVPLDWARTQAKLGNALVALGERGSSTARLEEAVQAYRAALQELTRQRVPLDWAITQDNLGNTLAALGEMQGVTAPLEDAIVAYRAALEELTRERVPLYWAATQNHLGNALEALGEQQGGTERLEQAVAAYRAALQERTRERVPLQWAASFGGQGVALTRIADRKNNLVIAETGMRQIQTAYEVARLGGDQQLLAEYSAQLEKAGAIRDRLKGK